MASNSAKVANVCPVCLETRPLKIAGRCKHSFCSECLTISLGTQKGQVFPCPTCKQDCPRPWDGVKGMVDFTGEVVAAVDILVDPLGKKGSRDGKNELERTGTDKSNVSLMPDERGTWETKEGQCQTKKGHGNQEKKTQDKVAGIPMDVKCTVCHHKKKEVQAVNLCAECGNLYICEECTKVHARNKATNGHVVVRLTSEAKQQEAMCTKHDTLLSSYCHECKEEVCMVCVMLDHGDHKVEKLADIVDVRIETLKLLLGERERELRELQGLKSELTVLEGETASLDKQDVLIKEIEEHAQRCIDHVVKWKEALKEEVKTSFSIVRDIPADLKTVSDVIEKLQEPIGSAVKLLSKMDRRQISLKELISQQKDLEATTDLGGDINRSGHLYRLAQLHFNDYSFIPNEIDTSFGGVESAEPLPLYFPGEFPIEVFKQTVQGSDSDTFIPCVANLGKKFAVAQPTGSSQPAVAIDIYEFPGKLKHTLTDHVPPLYDMSSTPDGKFAVLSRVTGGTGCTIKLFDPDAGYISSTREIDIPQLLSLGVTIRHQYVILGGNHQGQKVISVVDKEGNLECSLAIDVDLEGQYSNYDLEVRPFSFVDPPHRTTCGGGHIFVMSSSEYAMYAIDDGEIQLRATFDYRPGYYLTDVSADLWGYHVLSCLDANEVVLEKWVTNQGNVLEDWRPNNDQNGSVVVRVSARDGYIVLSRGRTIQVFKE